MNGTEAKKKLCELRRNLNDTDATKALWIAIRAIDTCINDGYEISD